MALMHKRGMQAKLEKVGGEEEGGCESPLNIVTETKRHQKPRCAYNALHWKAWSRATTAGEACATHPLSCVSLTPCCSPGSRAGRQEIQFVTEVPPTTFAQTIHSSPLTFHIESSKNNRRCQASRDGARIHLPYPQDKTMCTGPN